MNTTANDTANHRRRRSAGMLLAASLLTLVSSCADPTDLTDPQIIVDRALEAHGSRILQNARFTFDFRGRQFSITRRNGLFSYERAYINSSGASIVEKLTNDGFFRDIDGVQSEMDSVTYRKMETSVNSVSYFALLPLPLNDPAVVKRFRGEVVMQGEPYYKIEVMFQQERGGRDYQDRFLYWFHKENFTMDYMAYYFYTNEEGSRFRKATNVRRIEGVRIADYLNYRAGGLTYDTIDRYDRLFNADSLDLVSEVNLDNVRIEILE